MLAFRRIAHSVVVAVVARLSYLLHRQVQVAPVIGGPVGVVAGQGVILQTVRGDVRGDRGAQAATVAVDEGSLVDDVIHRLADMDIVEGRNREVHADIPEAVP